MQGVPDTKRRKQFFSSLPHLSQSFLLFSIPVNRLDLSKGSASKREIQIQLRSELYGHHSPSFEKFIISLYSKWWSQLFNAGDTSIIRRILTEILEKRSNLMGDRVRSCLSLVLGRSLNSLYCSWKKQTLSDIDWEQEYNSGSVNGLLERPIMPF